MRVIIVAALLIVAAAAAFALGRTTVRTTVPEAPMETNEREITARIGDAFRVPPLALYCLSYLELDRPKLLCEHTSERPRYEVIFERNRTVVVRIGHPEEQTIFPER
jgi:hypothetical protein